MGKRIRRLRALPYVCKFSWRFLRRYPGTPVAGRICTTSLRALWRHMACLPGFDLRRSVLHFPCQTSSSPSVFSISIPTFKKHLFALLIFVFGCALCLPFYTNTSRNGFPRQADLLTHTSRCSSRAPCIELLFCFPAWLYVLTQAFQYGGLARPCSHPCYHPSVFASCLCIFGPHPSHPFPTFPRQLYSHYYRYRRYPPYGVHLPCRPSSIIVHYAPRPSSVSSLHLRHAHLYSFVTSFHRHILRSIVHFRRLLHPFPSLLYHDLH